MTLTPNDDGMPAINEQLAANIKLVDREIRDSYSAASVEDIKPIAARDFASIGMELSDSDLDAYAQSVADGEHFDFTQH